MKNVVLCLVIIMLPFVNGCIALEFSPKLKKSNLFNVERILEGRPVNDVSDEKLFYVKLPKAEDHPGEVGMVVGAIAFPPVGALFGAFVGEYVKGEQEKKTKAEEEKRVLKQKKTQPVEKGVPKKDGQIPLEYYRKMVKEAEEKRKKERRIIDPVLIKRIKDIQEKSRKREKAFREKQREEALQGAKEKMEEMMKRE